MSGRDVRGDVMPLIVGNRGVDLAATFEALEKRVAELEALVATLQNHPALTKAELIEAIEQPKESR